jgi:hypothetical protein
MPEIGTSGLMSGDGKRGDGQRPSHRAHPRLYRSGNFSVPDSPLLKSLVSLAATVRERLHEA